VTDAEQVRGLRRAAGEVHVAPALADYAVRLVRATREQEAVLAVGASPRASLFLVRAARARALLDGRDYATPHDVKRVAHAVLRHRLILSYEAEADGASADGAVDRLLAAVETP
jgi:MoxR-like ATPase